MDYLQEMISLTNDSSLDLSNEEREILVSFTDEKVGFVQGNNVDYSNNTLLKNALHKLIDKDFFIRYLDILMKRETYSMKNFSERMDDE